MGNQPYHWSPDLLCRLCSSSEFCPFFILVYLESEEDHCMRLMNTWQWLTRMLPAVLTVRCLPIYTRKSETRVGLSASQITIEAFTEAIKELIQFDELRWNSLGALQQT